MRKMAVMLLLSMLFLSLLGFIVLASPTVRSDGGISLDFGSGDMRVEKEYITCDYLSCLSEITVTNTDKNPLVLKSNQIDVSIPSTKWYQIYTIESYDVNVTVLNIDKSVNCSYISTHYKNVLTDRRITLVNHTSLDNKLDYIGSYNLLDDTMYIYSNYTLITIQPGQSKTFYFKAIMPSPNTFYKYDVNILEGITFTIDPYFNTTNTTFDNGVYNGTQLNDTGFVGLGARELEDSGVSTTDNQLLFHFNNDSNHGENHSNVYDFSGNDNNGTALNGAVYTSSGKLSGAYSFDGANDFINCSNILDFKANQPWTLSAWVNPSVVNTFKPVVGRFEQSAGQDGYLLAVGGYDNVGEIVAWMADDNNNRIVRRSAGVLTVNKWYYITATYDGSTSVNGLHLYINGILSDGATISSGTVGDPEYNDPLKVGASQTYYYNGSIDEVAIWNRSLSGDEIMDLYLQRDGVYTSEVFYNGGNKSWSNLSWSEGVPYGEELPDGQGNELASNVRGGANMTGNVLLFHFNNDSSYNENNSQVYDFSGQDNNASTVINAHYTGLGKLGSGGYLFDGTGDYLNVSHDTSISFDFNDEFTYSLWMKRSSFGYDSRFIEKRAGNSENPFIGFVAGDNTYFRMTDASNNILLAVTSTNTVKDTGWHHYVFTYSNVSAISYFDGVQVGIDNTVSKYDPRNTEPLMIGCRGQTASNCFNGTMDEFAIWNRKLSATEVNDLYRRGAHQLNVSLKTCEVSDCSDGTWSTPYTNSSFNSLSLINSTYLQYKADIYSDNRTRGTPELYNVTIGYMDLDVSPPTINLSSPSNNTENVTGLNIIFEYIANDESNISSCSLIIDDIVNKTNTSITAGITQNFALVMTSTGDYSWSVNCTDNSDYLNVNASGVFNLSIINDTIAPIVSLQSPSNNTNWTSNNTVLFEYNVSDAGNSINNCSLIFNNVINQTNTSITEGVTQNFMLEVTNQVMDWSVNCTDNSDYYNVGASEVYTLDVSVMTFMSVSVNCGLDWCKVEW